jgi:hypothetical protein
MGMITRIKMQKFDSLQQIIQRYPSSAYTAQRLGYVKANTPFYEALYVYFKPQMPYEVVKARTGDPEDWIEQKLEDMGFFDNPITRRY